MFLRNLCVEPLEKRQLLASVSLISNKDNTLFQSNAGLVSDGIGSSMAVGLNHSDFTSMRAVLAFDLSSIPAGATITSVSLSLWENMSFTSSSAPSVELHKVTKAWGEGSSQPSGFMPPYGSAKTGDATWIHSSYPSVQWATAGGDFVSTVSAATVMRNVGAYTWNSTQMVSDVQSWLDNPSSNFGWLLKGNETQESGKLIDTRESTTTAHKPTLTVNYTVAASTPDLSIQKSHVGTFRQGDTADNYSVVVTNSGAGATSGTVTVTDNVPVGMTPTAASGTGWTTNINGNVVTATRTDVLAAGAAYPALQVTVSVASNAPSSLTNSVSVSGGGETNTSNDIANDITSISGTADLTISKSHSGTFRQGDSADTYSISVTNSGTGATTGTVTVTDVLPTGLNFVSATGSGWTTSINGATVTATRSDTLAIGASYPTLNIVVSIANDAASSLTNSARVSGGGELNTSNDTANDITTIAGNPDLTISKSHVGSFRQGDSGDNYTLTVNNVGTGPTTGVVTVTDTLPTGLTAVSAVGTGWTTSINGATITATRNDALLAGSSYPTLTLTVAVASTAPSSLTNHATVAGGGEVVTSNDFADDITAIASQADLSLTKSHSGNFRQGDTSDNYTIVVHNVGLGPTNGLVTLTDTLPTGLVPLTAIGTGWTTSINGSLVTATRNDALNASANYPTLTVTVRVANDAPASVTNTAAVAGGGQSNLSNDSMSDPTSIDGVADLTIAKSHSDVFRQGDASHAFILNVANAGRGATSGLVTVTDTIPTGLTALTAVGTGWTTQITGSVVTATRNDVLGANSSYPAITITTSVSNTASASVTNVAQVAGGSELNTANDTASDVVAIAQASDLTVAKTHTGNFHQASTNAQYTITVSNRGAGATTGLVTLTDVLPVGLNPLTAVGTGWTTNINGRTVTASRTDALATNATYPTLTITVSVANDAPTSITNTASVSGGGELNTSNDTASDITVVTPPVSDLVVRKTHTASFRQGDSADTYLVVVSNAGSASTSGEVVVTDTMPTGLTATAAAGTGWTTSINGSTVTARRSDALAAGADYSTLTLTVRVANDAPAQLINSVQVTGGSETDTFNNSASDTTAITPVADLTIAKSHAGSFVQGDARDTYTIVVTNAGAGTTTGQVTITDTLPTGLTAIDAVGTGWTTNINAGVITAQRSDGLAATSSYPTLTIGVRVANDAPTSIVNTAVVSGGGELNSANDSASDTVTVALPADLQITATHSGTFQQGDTTDQITLVTRNAGASPTSGTVTVTNTLPAGVTAISAAGSGWTTSINGNVVTATRTDALAAGASYPAIAITVSIATSASASVVNSANVSGGAEINTSNNTSSDTIAIQVASSKISGFVYLDSANTGSQTKSTGGTLPGLPGISVQLLKQDSQGNWQEVAGKSPVSVAADGSYQFDGLLAATYRVQVVTPSSMLNGKMSIGNVSGTVTGTSTTQQFEIPLVAGGNGQNYNFGMMGLKPTAISRRLAMASTPPLSQLWAQLNPTTPSVAVQSTPNLATQTNLSTQSIANNGASSSNSPGEGEAKKGTASTKPTSINAIPSPSTAAVVTDSTSVKSKTNVNAAKAAPMVVSRRMSLASSANAVAKAVDTVFSDTNHW